MPDLGVHMVEVTLAYAGSILMLLVLVVLSAAQARRAKHQLAEAEGRAKDG